MLFQKGVLVGCFNTVTGFVNVSLSGQGSAGDVCTHWYSHACRILGVLLLLKTYYFNCST
jgi:hypothetical protein